MPDPTSGGRNALPAGLSTALSAVTEILTQRLRNADAKADLQGKAAAEDLAVALEELHVVSDELEAQLRNVEAERQRSAYFFDAAPYAFLTTDLAGTITEANRAAVALLRVLPDWLVGKPLFAFVADEERTALRHKLASLVSRGEDAWVEWQLTVVPRGASAGVPAHLHVRAMPYGQRGASIFWVIRARDAG
jgi:PAS domain S-box-containing protein